MRSKVSSTTSSSRAVRRVVSSHTGVQVFCQCFRDFVGEAGIVFVDCLETGLLLSLV